MKRLKVIAFSDEDYSGKTPENELELFKDQLDGFAFSEYKIDIKRVFLEEDQSNELWDILICDWGAMGGRHATPGETKIISQYCGIVHTLAEMYPSRLIIIWSQCTGFFYEEWRREGREELPNILIDQEIIGRTIEMYFGKV